MSVDVALLTLFGLAVLLGAYRMARLDALYAGFAFFFLVYTIFAMIGYRFYPLLSQVLNAYFGVGLYYQYFAFVAASFLAYGLSVTMLQPSLVGGDLFEVQYRPQAITKWVALIVATGLVAWMGATLPRIYGSISYGGNPQIPNFTYAVLFKNSIFIVLLLWVFARRHAQSRFERVVAWGLVVVLFVLFLLTAIKAAGRTDILALLLGLAWYELSPFMLDTRWRLQVRWTRDFARTLAILVIGATVAWVLMAAISGSRSAAGAESIPTYALVLFNDYYAPAHILFGSLAYHYVRPLLVLQSNIANALLVGRVLDIPYLQTEMGNMLLPGSSSRSASFAYYIFTEGYMAAGPWLGVVYNGIVPVICISLWRRLGRTTDIYYNALVGALCAMSLATVARSGNFLLVRIYVFALLPYLLTFRVITGAKLGRSRRLVAALPKDEAAHLVLDPSAPNL